MIPFGVSLKCSRIRSTSLLSGMIAVPPVFTQMLSGSDNRSRKRLHYSRASPAATMFFAM